jgi:hypothetical protein
MANDWQGEELDVLEERSINASDIRGEMLDWGDAYVETRPQDYEEGIENPFVALVRERLDAVQPTDGARDTFEGWYEDMPPSYEICRAEALTYLNDEPDAAGHILAGRVGLHEIPKELRGEGAASERAQWVTAKAAEVGARNAEWLESLTSIEL